MAANRALKAQEERDSSIINVTKKGDNVYNKTYEV